MHKMTWNVKTVQRRGRQPLSVTGGVRCECGWQSPTQDDGAKAEQEFREHAPDYCPHCMADPCRC